MQTSKPMDYLSNLQGRVSADLAGKINKLEMMYSKKLWHQLTLELLEIVKEPFFQQGCQALELYNSFISDFENRINPLSLVEICGIVMEQIVDVNDQISFIKKIETKVPSSTEAKSLCRIFAGHRILHVLKDEAGAKKNIEEVEELLDSVDGVTPVHGRFYLLQSDLFRIQGKHAEYYRSALRFLGCTDISTLSTEEAHTHAFLLGMAALLGEGVYNLGELLAHPVLETLRTTEKGWLIDVLFAFNSGNIAGFDKLRPFWSTQADLVANERLLRQKLVLLALMEMTFQRSATQRLLTFTEIANTTALPENEVELLVMRALSQELLKGTIDQVAKTAHFTWVQPRTLDKQQLGTMIERLHVWTQDISSMESLLETKAHDILTF
ncbi:26S proteasome non-ATPase regulatory subunit 13-like isoform X2 [Artemia franciscana]